MPMQPDPLRRFGPQVVAIVIVGVLYILSREPALTGREKADEAARFRFARLPLPELAGPVYKRTREEMVRRVHPGLRHISAFVSFVGAAVAPTDLDGDGLPNDILLVDPRIDRVIVAAAPGTSPRYEPFTMDPTPLPFDSSTMAPVGCLPGDFNEDGWTDVLIYYWGRSPIVFLQRADRVPGNPANLGRDRFVPRELLATHQRWYTGSATRADLDGDGHIDLIVGNYFPDGSRILDADETGPATMPDSLSRAHNGGRKHLFLFSGINDHGPEPSVFFREIEGALDEEVSRGWTFAIGAADLDGDMLPELYFVHDWGPDRLLHNRSQRGRLRFERLVGERTMTTPRSKVIGRDSFNGMGMDLGDLNGDGWPDLVVSNITSAYGLHESHFVFLSTGQVGRMRTGIAPYVDASERLGLSRSGWGWDIRLADFDNDGVLEVIQAAGFLKGSIDRWPEAQELAIANDGLISSPRTWARLEPGDAMSGEDHNPFFTRR